MFKVEYSLYKKNQFEILTACLKLLISQTDSFMFIVMYPAKREFVQ